MPESSLRRNFPAYYFLEARDGVTNHNEADSACRFDDGRRYDFARYGELFDENRESEIQSDKLIPVIINVPFTSLNTIVPSSPIITPAS